MHRIDDDAGEAAGVEQAVLEIEMPGARLLRHQPPLQAIGEAGDDAFKIGELLVELLAQPGELLGVAQRTRRR